MTDEPRVPSEGEALVRNLRDAAIEARRISGETIFLDEYVERVKRTPTIAASAHARVWAMLEAAGFAPPAADGSPPLARFFENEVFGLERPLHDISRYFESAARGHETRRRILLLWGPPGGAKSTIAALLKRGLERFSLTDAGAVYALAGCPMHEEPLHLVPEPVETGGDDMRARVATYTGVAVEGGLCPHCRHRQEHELEGDVSRFPIQRIALSEAKRIGIGTFAPSDPKSMSIEQLTGGINFRALEEYGSDDDPRALDWAGEFMKANRGLLECIEVFKNPREFLYTFLTLSQERQFKVGKFGVIDADIVLIGHTNESEFRAFMSDPRNEALRDRLITVSVPYNLRVSDERRIYAKLLDKARGGFHVDPHALEAAATVAVLTRLAEHEPLSRVDKMRLYDGEATGEWKPNQAAELQRSAEREGMTGLGPRFVIDVLSRAVIDEQRAGEHHACLTTVAGLRSLRTAIERLELSEERRKDYLAQLTDARKEVDGLLKDEVRKAFIPAFADRAQAILENYLTNCEAYCQKERLRDPITGEEVEPDERLLRAVEEQIGVTENAKDAFRQGVLMRIGIWMRKGRPLTYRSDEQLGRAIEAHLFEEMQDIVRVTVSKRSPDPDQAKRLNEVTRVLVEEREYCITCSTALLDYVGALLNR
jgi:serine protein kinase